MGMEIIILAAGQGTRMHSALPKVLHPLGGAPLLQHVITAARALRADAIHVVYGHGGEQVRATLADAAVDWVEQAEQLGTGHAVAQPLPAIADGQTVLILYGDVPLIGVATLQALAEPASRGDLGLLTAILDNPFGYGRILRDDTGRVTGIVEEKDASDAQRQVREVNTGFLAANAGRLKQWVAQLGTGNAQGEYYLTDVIGLAAAAGVPIHTLQPASLFEVLGVNDRVQLAALERHYQFQRAEALMRAGVTLRDPARIDIRGNLTMGRDCLLDVNLVFEGEVHIGERVSIGPNCVIRDSRIGDDVVIHANCVIEEADIGAASRIGPFARLRPETKLAEQVHVGNFVEVKKSEVARGSKINHLSYVGDSTIGSRVNLGAGTITCNYDGANKHRTVIGDDVFIGSDTQLVAPVTVGDGATIGAGSTITRDVPPNELTLSRSKQETRKGWKRPVKKK
jgi:bifunctional UDP-N-acetylglucosamine pyrophosphorylase/glucosamine-1-phosphate N-acetyltransferase